MRINDKRTTCRNHLQQGCWSKQTLLYSPQRVRQRCRRQRLTTRQARRLGRRCRLNRL
jgi:hypothetical protein